MTDAVALDKENQTETFLSAFNGKFFGVLRWNQVDDLWAVLKKAEDSKWYVYAVGEEPPTKALEHKEFVTVIEKINTLLRQEHDEDYCGIIYTDDFKKPNFIKVFDPNNIGTSCSIATKGPLPGWVLSKIPPIDLAEANKPTANRRRWWQKILGK